ncbi:hypothetical protein [Emticicia sp. BO119]|uniref:hypothetical protein n=1 Tax=Emticicia sp. BO119 TaxID=2757768 RepID=UPI0015EFDED0|nr:hypothetical protein [Emticicia sp. BO119]MBA4852058.1 hypothetical protein [Emticicia sp. BO119]
MTITTKYDFQELVFLKHDPAQEMWMITAFEARADGGLVYKLLQGAKESWHLECEISREKDELKAVL